LSASTAVGPQQLAEQTCHNAARIEDPPMSRLPHDKAHTPAKMIAYDPEVG
jgi:hypothetical protein